MQPSDVSTAPLSFQQEDIVASMVRAPEYAPRYDHVFLFRFDAEVDVPSLGSAIIDVVKRHPALRTTLEKTADGYVQKVRAAEEFQVESRDSADASVDDLVRELIDTRLSADEILGGRFLFRPCVHTLGAKSERLLSVTLNHLINDGWSVIALWRDLAECYAAQVDGRAPVLPELTVTYADFARLQRDSWPEVAQRAIPYYTKLLEGCDGNIPWPQPGVAADGASWQTGGIDLTLSERSVASVQAISRTARVSPFMVLLAATLFGVARVTGKNDLLAQTDMASRNNVQWQNVVGHFVNAQITRVRIDPARPLLDVVKAVREVWMAADDFRDVYAEQALKEIGAPAPLTVNMPTFRPDWLELYSNLHFRDVPSTHIPVTPEVKTWRDFYVFWLCQNEGYRAHVGHQLSRVDKATATAVAQEIVTVLDDALVAG